MTITEKLDLFILNEGKGSERDALNIALSRLDQKQLIIKRRDLEIHQLREEVERMRGEIEMIGAGF